MKKSVKKPIEKKSLEVHHERREPKTEATDTHSHTVHSSSTSTVHNSGTSSSLSENIEEG